MSDSVDILLVDNEQDSVDTRLKWLDEAGYTATPITTLSGAWACIEDYKDENNGKLPLVLLDIMMPTIGDLDWLSDYEKEKLKITAPTAGLVFAEKLKETYSDIKIAWHSVRHSDEIAVAEKIKKLGFGLVQKDLQNQTEFLKEIKEVFKL